MQQSSFFLNKSLKANTINLISKVYFLAFILNFGMNVQLKPVDSYFRPLSLLLTLLHRFDKVAVSGEFN